MDVAVLLSALHAHAAAGAHEHGHGHHFHQHGGEEDAQGGLGGGIVHLA